jgi:hypothetical protein
MIPPSSDTLMSSSSRRLNQRGSRRFVLIFRPHTWGLQWCRFEVYMNCRIPDLLQVLFKITKPLEELIAESRARRVRRLCERSAAWDFTQR